MLAVSIVLMLLLSITPNYVFAQQPIQVFVDGNQLSFTNQPIIENGRTLVEFRPIFEKLGLNILWDGNTKTVTGYKDGLSIKLKIGDAKVIVNGETKALEIAPKIINGRTLIPLRFISESSGKYVEWNGTNRTIKISNTLTLVDGGIYTGSFRDNLPDGKGTLISKDGTKIEGNFVRGNAIGQMKIFLTNGQKIEIDYINNKPGTHGTIIMPDGRKYVGEINNFSAHGLGSLYSSSGKLIYKGEWKDGNVNGQGTAYDDYGNVIYSGEFVNGNAVVQTPEPSVPDNDNVQDGGSDSENEILIKYYQDQIAEINAEIDAVKADTRYELITADGQRIFTYNEAEVRRLESLREDWQLLLDLALARA